MNDIHFENAFPSVPSVVHLRLEKALEEKNMNLNKAKRPVATLAIVLALLLGLMGMAYAANYTGILDFAKEHKEKVEPAYLIDNLEKSEYSMEDPRFVYDSSRGYVWTVSESELVEVELEELLFDEGWMYAVMTVNPRQKNTMVIGTDLKRVDEKTGEVQLHLLGGLDDITEPGSMKKYVPKGDAHSQLSVQEYAQKMGFEQVVRVALSREMKHVDYTLMEEGSLRMIAQMKDPFQKNTEYSEHLRKVSLCLTAVQYDESGRMPMAAEAQEIVNVQFIGPAFVDSRTRKSIPEDSHYLKGFRITMDRVIVVPINDDEVNVILRIKEDRYGQDLRNLKGPIAMIMSETGDALYEYALEWDRIDQEAMLYYEEGVQFRITMPREGLTDDKITIRLHNAQNRKIVYDKYTYTLK